MVHSYMFRKHNIESIKIYLCEGRVNSSPPPKPRPAALLPQAGNPGPARKPLCKAAGPFIPGGLQSPLPRPAIGTMLAGGRICPADAPGAVGAPGIGAAPGLTYCITKINNLINDFDSVLHQNIRKHIQSVEETTWKVLGERTIKMPEERNMTKIFPSKNMIEIKLFTKLYHYR